MKLAIGIVLSLVVSGAVSNPHGTSERKDNSEDDNDWEESSAFDDVDDDPTATDEDGYYAANRGEFSYRQNSFRNTKNLITFTWNDYILNMLLLTHRRQCAGRR